MSKCSNGYCKFDSYTTTNIKINNMFKVKQNDIFAKNMSKSELYQTTKMSKNNSTKLVSEYDKVSFDKWMNDLIAKNGTTNY